MAVGENFFDSSYFDNATIFDTYIDTNLIDYKKNLDKTEILTLGKLYPSLELESYYSKILEEFSSFGFCGALLALPIVDVNTRLYHFFEKVLWLIQNYSIEGKWVNPIKLVNFMDYKNDPLYICHPGGNRISASRFLGLKKMHSLLSVHKLQTRYEIENFNCFDVVDTEEKLRSKMTSATPDVLVRTEGQMPLCIDSKKTSLDWMDYTYEFTGADAWPYRKLPTNYVEKVQSEYQHWNDLVWNSFPLHVNNPNKVKYGCSVAGKFFMHHRLKYLKKIECIETESLSPAISIELHRPVRDILELLFFMHPQYSRANTADNSIIIRNNNFPGNELDKVILIPDDFIARNV